MDLLRLSLGSILGQHEHPKYSRLSIQLRHKSRFYQDVVFLDGRKVQKSLKTDQLSTAFKLGEQWYRKLLRPVCRRGAGIRSTDSRQTRPSPSVSGSDPIA